MNIHRIGHCCAVLLLCLPRCGVPADDCPAWRQVATGPEGSLFHRCRPGPFPGEVMIEREFRAAPERLFRLANDYEAFEEFVPDVLDSRVLARDGMVQWVYHRLHVPGPGADRVYVIRSTRTAQGPRHWRVEWTLSERAFAAADLAAGVVPGALSGAWDITRTAQGGSSARYVLQIDPGGLVPDWLAQRLVDRYAERVMAAFRQRLGE